MAALCDGDDPLSIPGVFWRGRDGTVTGTAPRTNTSLDDLPFPDMDLLDTAYYTSPGFNVFRGRYLSSICLLASRGCPHRCDFCSESLTYGSGVRYHSPEYVLEWMEKLLVDHGVDGLYFMDNNFLQDRVFAQTVCEGILSRTWPRRFTWAVQARTDCIDSALIGLMKRAGCSALEIGVESAFQHRLASVHKATTVETNERAITLCREAGVSVFAYMIMGFEDETIADLDAALAWVKRTRPTSFGWRYLSLYPGTRLYETHGERYFETNQWDEATIGEYYKRSPLSTIDDETLTRWLRRHYAPHEVWRRTLAALRGTSPLTLLKVALRDPEIRRDLLRNLFEKVGIGV
jgi:radical SAM superfamily enzyme YgiQ (UPF0313 family)